MPLIHPKGSPSSRIWVIPDHPLSTDSHKGYMFSGGLGFVFDKMMREAGIPDYYVIARKPDTTQQEYVQDIDSLLNQYHPPFILPMGSAGMHFASELQPQTRDRSYVTALNKYVGSLLKCKRLDFSHYVFPLPTPDFAVKDWTERQIITYFDLQKLREEFKYWKTHGVVQPLPYRNLIHNTFLPLPNLLRYLDRFSKASLISVDIETCYPKVDSDFYPHPGYPLTIGIADSAEFGISFELFREDIHETKILWRALSELLASVPQLGQNYFNFDAHFLQMLGFNIPLRRCKDTLIRHHVLWPELPHKLQFQTRQYTREPYYKDEGHHWSFKNLSKLKRYNCLDVCVTYEIYKAQEEEFMLRKEIA